MDFSQYAGFLLFLFIFTTGFWLLIFGLTFIVPYWLVGSWVERFKENRTNKAKRKAKSEDIAEDAIL